MRGTLQRTAYLAGIVVVAAGFTALLALMVDWERTSWLAASLWIGGLFVLLLNIGYIVVMSFCSLFITPAVLPEFALDEVPPTALLYVVKNERGVLEERMATAFANSRLANVHLWLVSNSDDHEVLARELRIIRRLQRRFGDENVHYYRPHNNPRGLKHLALQEWARSHEGYRYVFVCDADTVPSPGAVARLLAKAEHPDNRHVVLLQTHLVARWSQTRFAAYLEPAQNTVHKVFCRVNYAMLGQSPYYGHGALARRDALGSLQIPDWVLSHDLWDTVALDCAGGTIAFCEDVEAYEMLPMNYLEFRRRSRRWILGNLQAAPLIFRRGLSVGARFILFMATYVYLVEPVLLGWILLGLFANNDLTHTHLATQSLLIGSAKVVDLEMSGVCVATLGVVWLHKIPYGRGPKEVYHILREVILGTLLLLNNLVYDSIVVLCSPRLDRTWRPMSKEFIEPLTLGDCMSQMLPSTCLGAVLLIFGAMFAPWWTLWTSPVLVSFLLGGLTVYFTSKPVSQNTSGSPQSSRDRFQTRKLSGLG